MKDIKYLDILKRSWQIVWHNKYLWWFGFFMALGGGGSLNFNFNLGNGNWEEKSGPGGEKAINFIANYWPWFVVGGALVILLCIIIFVLRLRGTAALVKSVEQIEKGKENDFKAGWKKGKKYFWKLLGTDLLLGISFLLLILALFTPVGLLFYFKAYITAILALMAAIAITIPLAIIYTFLREYANLYIILSDLGIQSALDSAYYLFRHNIWPGIILALIFIPVKLVLLLAVFSMLLLIALIFLVLGIILYLLFHAVGIAIAVSFGILIFVAVALFLASVYETFYQTAWVLFFKEIASEKVKKPVEEAVEIAKDKIPNPEEA